MMEETIARAALPAIPVPEDMETFLLSQDFFNAVLKLPHCQVCISGNLLWINAGKTHLMVRTGAGDAVFGDEENAAAAKN